MILRRLFFCAALVVALAISAATAPRAFAQDPNRMSDLKVFVWPEYDQPTVLVMVDGTLADQSNLPREVAVLVPSNASLLVTTYENSDGSLAQEQPNKSTSAGDGYARVTFTVKTPKYHVEYYENLLRGAPDKTIDFALKTAAPADKVTLEFQQPLKATNFTVSPQPTGSRVESGFNLYDLELANVTAGQLLAAQVKYTKSDPNPSVTSPSAQSPAPAGATAPAAPSNWGNVYLIVAIVVLGLAAVLGFVLLQQRSGEPLPFLAGSARRGRDTGARPKGARRGSGGAKVFCTQCGHPLGPEDNFCPKCGTRRRAAG